jgi:acetylornithine deacetylase/succinyl-diaminopimelate desuccinylase-like protein
MAVAFKHLADGGFTPKGTLIYLAVADEEALGTFGASWLTEHEFEAVNADYVLTESGGFQMPSPDGPRLPVMVEEKGTYWSKLTVHGTPGHGSQPFRTDNALVTASEVVRRIAAYKPPPQLEGTWTAFVEGMHFPQELTTGLLDPDGIDEYLETLPVGFSRLAHACTHTTFSPNVVHGGTKTNVIPDTVEIEVDIRTLPGQEGDAARAMVVEAVGDLIDRVDIWSNDDPSTKSEIDTPLWNAMTRVTGRLCEGSALVPFMMVGGTDNRYFRRAGSVGYGFGLFSEKLKFEDYASMFHGNNERVDQDSLLLSTELWLALAREFLT